MYAELTTDDDVTQEQVDDLVEFLRDEWEANGRFDFYFFRDEETIEVDEL